MGTYDRRIAAGQSLEHVLLAWFKAAAPIFEMAMVKAAHFDPKKTTTKSRIQSNLVELDVRAVIPFNPEGGWTNGETLPADIHIEWSLAPSTLATYVTATFEGGGEVKREFNFSFHDDPATQGHVVGGWLLKLEPEPPDES